LQIARIRTIAFVSDKVKLVWVKEDFMLQATFSLSESQTRFLELYKDYGFKDKSALVREALRCLQQELERENLRKSAGLYAEIYEEDEEVRELTESALAGWPA